MRTIKEAQDFVDRIYQSWRKVYYNFNIKSVEFSLNEYDQFTSNYYSEFDSFKNLVDIGRQYLFEQLPQDYQDRFNEIIIQYNERGRLLTSDRRQLDNIKLQNQIDEMNKRGLFAHSKPPTLDEVTQSWLNSYRGNTTIFS